MNKQILPLGSKRRVLAGMRASGKLHLGNYYGGAKGMLALQDNPEYETYYMVADLHAITTPFNKDELASASRNVVLDYLSAGLDPEKSTIFIDSHVPEVTELAYLFSSVVTIARMQHLPTFKERVKQYPEDSMMALLNYPVLMAADILAFKADLVPVGIDQEPHLEVAREVARKMNAEYDTDFPQPKRFTVQGGEYVPSLSGEGKMSKSVKGSAIVLTDDLDTIKERLAKVQTDSGKGEVRGEKNKLYFSENGESRGVGVLFNLVGIFEGEQKRKEYEHLYESEGLRYKDLKEELAYAIYQEIRPLQEKRKEYEDDPERVDLILKEGAENARIIAKDTVSEVKKKMGFMLNHK